VGIKTNLSISPTDIVIFGGVGLILYWWFFGGGKGVAEFFGEVVNPFSDSNTQARIDRAQQYLDNIQAGGNPYLKNWYGQLHIQ